MSLLGNIFENEQIKKLAFGQLKKLIRSENLGLIVVRLDPESDELLIDMYKPGEAVITIHAPDAGAAISAEMPQNPEIHLLTEKPLENANA